MWLTRGFKLTMALDYRTRRPFVLHEKLCAMIPRFSSPLWKNRRGETQLGKEIL